jgi:hypothetical protein
MPFCQDSEWATPPNGTYIIAVFNAKEGAFRTGTKYIQLECEILEGKHAGLQFMEQMPLWKVSAFGQALQLPKQQDPQTKKWGYQIEAMDLINRKFQVSTMLETYEGRVSCRIVRDGIKNLGYADEDSTAASPSKVPF